MAMPPKSRGNPIVRTQGRADAHRRRLLSLALMDRSRHGALQEQELHPLFEFSDEHHALVKSEQERLFIFSPRDRLGSRGRINRAEQRATRPGLSRGMDVSL